MTIFGGRIFRNGAARRGKQGEENDIWEYPGVYVYLYDPISQRADVPSRFRAIPPYANSRALSFRVGEEEQRDEDGNAEERASRERPERLNFGEASRNKE